MRKRQETSYASRIKAMSRPELVEEIAATVSLSLDRGTSKETEDKISLLIAEDNRRDGFCYDDAMSKVNAARGFDKTESGKFTMRG